MVNLLFVCGSPRKESTAYILEETKRCIEDQFPAVIDILYLKGKEIHGCIGCNACLHQNQRKCVLFEDDMGDWNERFFQYDGILIGSPVYAMSITPQLSAFFSRFRSEWLTYAENRHRRTYLPGAALAVGGTRNGGQEHAIAAIHGFFQTHGLPIISGGMKPYSGACIVTNNLNKKGAAQDDIGLENAFLIAEKLYLTAEALKQVAPK